MSFTENSRFTFENNTNFEGNNNANNDDILIDRNRTIRNSPMPMNQTNTNNLDNQQESILSLPTPPPPPPPSSQTPLNRSTMLTPSSSSVDSSGIMEHSEFSQMRYVNNKPFLFLFLYLFMPMSVPDCVFICFVTVSIIHIKCQLIEYLFF